MDAEGRIHFGGEDITDLLTCPICYKVPDETIYQCRNGHVSCHKCYPRLKTCGECREEFESNPIRNLLVQRMLDGQKVACSFKDNGCVTRMYKHLVSDHDAVCSYNFKKFGPLVNLCQKLGYPTCNFKVNDGNTAAAIQHFQSAHGFHLAQSGQLQMELEHFKEAITLKKNHYWTPVIVKLSARQSHLLILPVQNEAKEFTCVSILFPDSKNSRPRWLQSLINVEYTVPLLDRFEFCKLIFAQRPVSIAQAANLELGTLPHSIKGQLVAEHMRDEVAMHIVCKIKQTLAPSAFQGPLTTFICQMRPRLETTGAKEKTRTWLKQAENDSKVDRENLWKFLWKMYEETNTTEGYTAKDFDHLKKETILLVYRLGTVSQLGYLRAKGFNLDYRFEKDWITNLQYLLRDDKDKKIGLEKIKALVNFGVDFKRRNDQGSSLLQFAISFGNEEIVKYVVEELKLDVNIQTNLGLTPFHYAVMEKDAKFAMKIAQLLLDHGADPAIGRDVLEYAEPKYKKKLEKMLRQHREKNSNNDSPV